MTEKKDFLDKNLFMHVYTLSHLIGARSVNKYENLCLARDYIINKFQTYGYSVELQNYFCGTKEVSNIIATKYGTEESEILVCGHYDSTDYTKGADDNSTAIAGVLEMARMMRNVPTKNTLKFICFVNEEAPHFLNETMGSLVFAKNSRRIGEPITDVIILEMIGYFSDEKDSQFYPDERLSYLFPTTGNFIFVGGNKDSIDLVNSIQDNFKKRTDLPIFSFPDERLTKYGITSMPDMNLSDHVSFQKYSYPAVFITDSAFYRNPHYHLPSDTVGTLDFYRMSKVVMGLEYAVTVLANK